MRKRDYYLEGVWMYPRSDVYSCWAHALEFEHSKFWEKSPKFDAATYFNRRSFSFGEIFCNFSISTVFTINLSTSEGNLPYPSFDSVWKWSPKLRKKTRFSSFKQIHISSQNRSESQKYQKRWCFWWIFLNLRKKPSKIKSSRKCEKNSG